MSQNIDLTRNFRDIIDRMEELFDNISDDEKRLKLIDKNEWAVTYVGLFLKLIIGILYLMIGVFVAALIDKSWWINLIGAFVALVFVETLITGPIFKSKAEKRLKLYQQDFKKLERELNDLMEDKLLPEIYPLGMMTAKNIIDKTSAKYLPVECVQEFMEKEVKRGNFEKIELKDDILYKGKHPKSLSNIETVFLEID